MLTTTLSLHFHSIKALTESVMGPLIFGAIGPCRIVNVPILCCAFLLPYFDLLCALLCSAVLCLLFFPLLCSALLCFVCFSFLSFALLCCALFAFLSSPLPCSALLCLLLFPLVCFVCSCFCSALSQVASSRLHVKADIVAEKLEKKTVVLSFKAGDRITAPPVANPLPFSSKVGARLPA